MKQTIIRGLSLLVVLLTLAGLAGPARAAAVETIPAPAAAGAQVLKIPRFEPGDCPDKIQQRIPPGDSAECGVLVVPERYSQPDGSTIELDVMIIPAITGTTAPDPIVFAQGGPGGSTIDYF